MGDFHWRDGWHFTRLANGDVQVTKRRVVQERVVEHETEGGPIRDRLITRAHRADPAGTDVRPVSSPFVELERLVIPADEWASIVASVSGRGETTASFDVARALHAG